MPAAIGDFVHRHAGRAAVVVGGAPSRLNEIAACPADAVWFSVNAHGLLARAHLNLGCDYIAALDPIAGELKGRGAPVLSTQRSADVLVFEMRCANSAIFAAWCAWVMGCAPIVVIGVECYAGKTYAHDPEAESAGRRFTVEQHLERWRLLARIAPGLMLRPVGGPLLQVFPRYDAAEACTAIADADVLRSASAGETLRFTRRYEGFAKGDVERFPKDQAQRLIAAKAAVRWGAAQAEEGALARKTPAAPFVYAAQGERTSPRFARAFAKGCGGEVVSEYRPGAWAGFGSSKVWPGLAETRRARRDWWYGDHAYFGRFRFYRVTRNAFQHCGAGRADHHRLAALDLEIRPWRTDGRHVLVCPPDAGWAELMAFDAGAWLAATLRKLGANTDREIRVRHRAAAHRTPLAADLERCWACVTHASNAAVEALVAGVPVIATGDCAARAMGLSDPASIEYPAYPEDRERWAAVLAANQWTLQEIAEGECWRRIGHAMV